MFIYEPNKVLNNKKEVKNHGEKEGEENGKEGQEVKEKNLQILLKVL
jgi:predicted transposase YdaD